MDKNTKSKRLTTEERIKAKVKAIQDAADEKIKQVKVQVAVSKQLADLCEVIKNFDAEGRSDIIFENIKALNKIGLGLSLEMGGSSAKVAKPQVSPDDILNFLSANGEKSTGEIQSHFGLSSVTVSAKLKGLGKKIEPRKDGTKKFWKVV